MEIPPTHKIEDFKAQLDYLKHLTTLSTGSIVLLVAFLEKIFLQPKWKFLVGISLIGFAISVVASVVEHTLTIFFFPGRNLTREGWLETLDSLSLLMAWLGFLIGIVSLVVFAMRNLF